jgi:hypothetical protein
MTTAAAGGGEADRQEDGAEAHSPLVAARAAAAAAAANAAPTTGTVLAGAKLTRSLEMPVSTAGPNVENGAATGSKRPPPSTMAVDLAPGPEGISPTISGQPDAEAPASFEAPPSSADVAVGEGGALPAASAIGNGEEPCSPRQELPTTSWDTHASSPFGKRRQPVKRKRSAAASGSAKPASTQT